MTDHAERTVCAEEELDALPDRTVLRDRSGFVWQKGLGGWDGTDGSQGYASGWLSRVASPLTVLVAETLLAVAPHVHDFRFDHRHEDTIIEKCADCPEQRRADYYR